MRAESYYDDLIKRSTSVKLINVRTEKSSSDKTHAEKTSVSKEDHNLLVTYFYSDKEEEEIEQSTLFLIGAVSFQMLAELLDINLSKSDESKFLTDSINDTDKDDLKEIGGLVIIKKDSVLCELIIAHYEGKDIAGAIQGCVLNNHQSLINLIQNSTIGKIAELQNIINNLDELRITKTHLQKVLDTRENTLNHSKVDPNKRGRRNG